MSPDDFPTWPPGFWRRIVLQPASGWIGGALEDDVHSFRLRVDHADGAITAVAAEALRHPWTACPGAVGALRDEFVGQRLDDIARRDPRPHCTHLFDLIGLCAAHTRDTAPLRFDMTVADRSDGRTTASLSEDGAERMCWLLDGLDIAGTGPMAGRSLRDLSKWKLELGPRDAERAMLLRRAVMVSGHRQFVPPPLERAADQGPKRMGVCYNYQLPQAENSTRVPNWQHDFSQSDHGPLAGFDPMPAFRALGGQA